MYDASYKQKASIVGSSAKSMHVSVKDSLKKLRTDYIDILYVHWWDFETPIEEMMNSLHNLVVQGKVLYLVRPTTFFVLHMLTSDPQGISDTSAWVVAKANTYAQIHGKTPFVIYQGQWNIMERSFERDIIPMARHLGMILHSVSSGRALTFDSHIGLALAPWDVLGAGKFRTDAEEEERKKSGERGRTLFSPAWERTEKEVIISRALEKVAGEVGTKNIRAGK